MSTNATLLEELGAREGAPPPRKNRPGDSLWLRRIELGVENPGTWFNYGGYQNSSVSRSVRNGVERYEEKNGPLEGTWEITTSTEEDDTVTVYVRYNLEAEE